MQCHISKEIYDQYIAFNVKVSFKEIESNNKSQINNILAY